MNSDNKAVTSRVVFVRAPNAKKKWLALLSTDLKLSDEEIVKLYKLRWDIEVFFKITKSHLQLAKEFQSRSYDALVAHTTIVFARYMMLELARRSTKDPRTLGTLFYAGCDEVAHPVTDSISRVHDANTGSFTKVDATSGLYILKDQFNFSVLHRLGRCES